jgi:DNA-binding response OmpR family regulator
MAEDRILVVEDEATTREILTELLRAEGYEVDSVATAGAATTCLNSLSYGLVVADWVLPDGDGTDVADNAAQRGSKTLIVSSHLSDLPAGVANRHALMSKQLGHAEIIAAVRRVIGGPAEKA